MRIPSLPLQRIVFLTVVGALFGGAIPTFGQRLVATVGDPVPYRVGVPSGAQIERDGYWMTVEMDDASMITTGVDLVALGERPLAGSDSEARRVTTEQYMGSDARLLGAIDEGRRLRNVELFGVVREIRTLGGERAGYIRGRTEKRQSAPWVEAYVTVKDGILYMLMFAGADHASTREGTLQARIHESFVLADAPPAELGAPAPRSGVLRRIEKSR